MEILLLSDMDDYHRLRLTIAQKPADDAGDDREKALDADHRLD